MNAKPMHVWLVIVTLHAVQTTYFYPRLPAVVAQHFGAQGLPNGWTPKQDFFLISWVILLFVSLVLMLSPRMMRGVPVSMINLPNKQYWLAPERKGESIAFVERQLEWMAVITVAFLALVMHLAIRANFTPDHRLENEIFIALVIAFVVAIALWIVKLYRRFPHPTSS